MNTISSSLLPWGGGGGDGVLPNISHIGMRAAPKGMVFVPFLSGIGYGFPGKLRKCMNAFIISIQMNKKGRNLFRWCSNLSNGDIIS